LGRRKVLFIAYYYPPLGGIGSLRAQKFACYLPEFGWQPIVLAPEHGCYFVDSSLEDGTERGVNVVRTPIADLSAFFNSIRLKGAVMAAHGGPTRQAEPAPAGGGVIVEKLKQAIRSWVYIPDGQVGWFPYALRAGRKVLGEEKVEAIWSTSFPVTAHMVAYRLKLATGKPWIADFRDLWTEHHGLNYTNTLRKRLDQLLEAKILGKADVIVTVSEALAESLRRLAPGAKRIEVIRNGFDSREFEAIERPRPVKWTVTFVGSYYDFYNPSPFLAALRRLINRGEIAKEHICFRVVGTTHSDLQDLVRQFDLEDITHFTGVVPHREALRYQLGSSLLLFVLHGGKASPGIITGKLYEYLGARKPILGIVPSNFEAAQIIRGAGAGVTVDAADAGGIEQCLLDSYSGFKSGGVRDVEGGDLSRFERRYGARQLAAMLTELAAR